MANGVSRTPQTPGLVTKTQLQILAALHRLGDTVNDPEHGRCTKLLADEAQTPLPSMTSHLSNLDANGYIIRDTRGKRTYEICMGELPDRVRADMLAVRTPPPRVTVPVAAREVPEPAAAASIPAAAASVDLPTTTPLGPPITISVSGVADALLKAVLARINEPGPGASSAQRLAETLEENERLRARNRKMSEDIITAYGERDRLQGTLKNKDAQIARMELNIEAMKKDGNRVTGDEIVASQLGRFVINQKPARRG